MSSAASSHGDLSTPKAAMVIGALGVVFGDIGTSPLYALREAVHHLPEAERAGAVYGVLSLIFWALISVVSIKYATVVMRAHNQGEGGIFALLALSWLEAWKPKKRAPVAIIIVLVGAAMLCGEGVITPAISVLSATEGLSMIMPAAHEYVIPICVVILIALFWVQRHGTHVIGSWFGPIMLVWFSTLGLLGLWRIWEAPQVLAAINPVHGWQLLSTHPHAVVGILGGVVLAITGVEALYADMGHFGRKAILRAW